MLHAVPRLPHLPIIAWIIDVCFLYSVFKVPYIPEKLRNVNGDGEIRTHDPLLARQVLSH